MRTFLLLCSAFLVLGLLNLPIGYYTFLRIIITLGAISVIAYEYNNELTFWVIIFAIIAILFNPIIPVYLNNKSSWVLIDIIAAFLFGYKAFKYKTKQD